MDAEIKSKLHYKYIAHTVRTTIKMHQKKTFVRKQETNGKIETEKVSDRNNHNKEYAQKSAAKRRKKIK